MAKKKQHYIQQSYLNKFCDGSMYVYSRKENKVYKASTEDIAEENKFYSLPIKKYYSSLTPENKQMIDSDIIARFGKPFDQLNNEEQIKVEEWIEDLFSEDVENNFLLFLHELEIRVGKFISGQIPGQLVLDNTLKSNLAYCLSIGYFRTKHMRDTASQALINLYKQVVPIICQMNQLNIDADQINVEMNDDQKQANQLKMITDLFEDETVAKALHSRKWVILVNKTDIPFVVSDTFLTMKLTKYVPEFYGVGILTPGIEIYFPINNRLMLVISDPSVVKTIGDGAVLPLENEERVMRTNMFIKNTCYERCFCKDKNVVETNPLKYIDEGIPFR